MVVSFPLPFRLTSECFRTHLRVKHFNLYPPEVRSDSEMIPFVVGDGSIQGVLNLGVSVSLQAVIIISFLYNYNLPRVQDKSGPCS